MTRRHAPFMCRVCREDRPHMFNAAMKTLCGKCRAARERERVAAMKMAAYARGATRLDARNATE